QAGQAGRGPAAPPRLPPFPRRACHEARGAASAVTRKARWQAIILLSFVGAVLLSGCHRPSSPRQSAAAQQASHVQFTDVTGQAGIRFKHFNGATGHRYLPETMGSGGAFLDYDGDGWLDILLLNGRPLQDNPQMAQI